MPPASCPRFTAGLLALFLVVGIVGCAPERVLTPTPSETTLTYAPRSTPTQTAKPQPIFDRSKYSIDDPLSLWVVNDKLRPLNPIDYAPPDLVLAPVRHISSPLMRPEAASAIVEMFAASVAEGAGEMQIQNSYRSYETQVNTHQYWVNQLGEVAADAESARAGYSEHQTGWTADVWEYPRGCGAVECFGETPQGIWLAANAWRFGFVIRYPEGKKDITGYIYEPWHVRYVGTYLSTEMHNTGTETLEEFFGLPPAPDYAH